MVPMFFTTFPITLAGAGDMRPWAPFRRRQGKALARTTKLDHTIAPSVSRVRSCAIRNASGTLPVRR